MRRIIIALLLSWSTLSAAAAADEDKITQRTKECQRISGYIPLYWDASKDQLLMEVNHFGKEILYQVSLSAGIGINDMDLDRGELGATRVIVFRRRGSKVLIEQPNYRHRTITNNPAERHSVEESFARSVIWGFNKVEAEDGDRVLVDATAFFLRDAYTQSTSGIADLLSTTMQGTKNPKYVFKENQSAIDLNRTKGFPKNSEVETILTFATNDQIDMDAAVSQVVPEPRAVTLRQHHSLVELPDLKAKEAYSPRRFDPRVGLFYQVFADYAAPMSEPLEKRWIWRHHLVKLDPASAVSEPIKPIVFYIDKGVPEPIRGALVEGASWWSTAFEAAGFKNAFQIKVLPDDADPMDVRYNTINWVHRSTRGWSSGVNVIDPRTGQIIKSTVTLDSSRARQDYLIGSGLTPSSGRTDRAAERSGKPDRESCQFAKAPEVTYLNSMAPPAELERMILARIRQLAVHEVGHALGLRHNFAASSYGRASVMDYPAPLVEIKDGRLDLSNAYITGIGTYDIFVIRYAYFQCAEMSNEADELERIVEKGITDGMLFITDYDAGPRTNEAAGAHPLASRWDNGDDPVAMLRHEMRVRRIGLEHFGLGNLPLGTPLSLLEAKLLPLYLHHRFQMLAAVKSVGGIYYTYAINTHRGPSPPRVTEIVPPARQREALEAILDTIRPEELVIPVQILQLIPPVAFGYRDSDSTAELFTKRTQPAFDPIGAATIATDLAISGLLQPERAARLIDFHSRDGANPDFKEIVDAIITRTWKGLRPQDPRVLAVSQAVQAVTVTRMMDLAANGKSSPQVRAVTTEALRELSAWLNQHLPVDETNAVHYQATRDNIERFLRRPYETYKQTEPLPKPPGDPIGSTN